MAALLFALGPVARAQYTAAFDRHTVVIDASYGCSNVHTSTDFRSSSIAIPIGADCNQALVSGQIAVSYPAATSHATESGYHLQFDTPLDTSIDVSAKFTAPFADAYTASAEVRPYYSIADTALSPGDRCTVAYVTSPTLYLPKGVTDLTVHRPCSPARIADLVWKDHDIVALTMTNDVNVDLQYNTANHLYVRARITTTYLVTYLSAPPISPPPPDLSIDHMEVVQAIQTADNSIPLVAGKKTAVRVFAKAPDGSAPLAGVTGRLQGFRDNVELPGSPLIPANGLISASAHPLRINPNDSLIFVLPPEWTTAGATRLVAEIAPAAGIDPNTDNNVLDKTFNFAPPANLPSPLIIAYWPLCYQPAGQVLQCPTDNVSRSDVLLRKMYPLPDDGVVYRRWMTPRKIWQSPLNTDDDAARFLGQARKLYSMTVDRVVGGADQLAAWFPSGVSNLLGLADATWADPNGQSRVTFNVDSSAADPLDPAMTLAHETGHNLGLRHTNTADSCGAKDNSKENQWPYDNSNIQEVGIDPFTLDVKPGLKKDVMSYCSPPASNIWISTYDYQLLMGSQALLRPLAATPQPLDAPASNQVVISGSARSDGSSGSLDPAFVVSSSVPLGPPHPSGNHCLRFFNVAGPLTDYCFTLRFAKARTLDPLDREFFALRVPYPADTTRIALLRDGNELASLAVSQDAPQVAITAPQAGDRWSGTQTLYWSGTDPAGRALTYSVLYSADGGQTWTPMDVDLQSAQYMFDTGEITAGSEVYFRVLASSGITTGSATVGPIAIAAAPKLVATPAALDFGVVTIGRQPDLQVTLTNTGNGPLTVTPGSDLLPPFSLPGSGTPFTIAPGGSASVTVRFKPTTGGSQSSPLTFYTDNSVQPSIALSAIGQGASANDPRIEISPAALDFGALSFGQAGELSLGIRNSGGAALEVRSAGSSDAQFAAVSPTAPLTVPPGGSLSLVVHFTAASPGQQSARLTLASNDPLQSSATVALTGQGAFPQAALSPTRLDFGAVAPGQIKDLALTVSNTGAANLTVRSVSSSAAAFAVSAQPTPFTLALGGNQTITVRFAPAAAGSQAATLSVATDDPVNPTLSVLLAGQTPSPAPAPAIVLSSDTFDRADAGQSALGQTDLRLGGTRTYCYVPVFSGATIVSKALGNNGTGYGGVQFGQPGSGGSCSFRGQNIGQDLNLVVDLLVPGDMPGNSSMAGPYFRNRGGAAADGILGGDSAGYWAQLDSSGQVKVVDAHTNIAVATAAQPANFDYSVVHTLEVAISGTTLQAALDHNVLTFTQGSGTTNTVSIPATGGTNDGTSGVPSAWLRIAAVSAANAPTTSW